MIERVHNRRGVRLTMVLGVISVWLAWSGVAPTAQAGGRVSRIRLGSVADVQPALIGPSFFLQGNGAPNPTAFQAHINQVASTSLDIVVLAASSPSSGSKTPECDALLALARVNSCETITIPAALGANDAGATATVNQAEIVYFAGGDQCNYIGWRGSTVITAVKNVVARGGGVGGGSAGLAIQGDYVYDACAGSVTSSAALSNPYDRAITFTYDLFHWQNLQQLITDTHFVARDRMGRLMTFVARQLQDGRTTAAYGLGIDEGAVFVVDRQGLGQLYGGTAYVVLGDHRPEVASSRKPLTFSNFKLWQVLPGGTYNFASRPASGYYLRSITAGVLSGDPYTP